MAEGVEEKQKEKKETKKEEKKGVAEKAQAIVRIADTDIPGEATIYHGLTLIKGVSWSLSNAICVALGLERTRKIMSLTPKEIENITAFLKQPRLPPFLLNRRFERTSGTSRHLITTDLDMQREVPLVLSNLL